MKIQGMQYYMHLSRLVMVKGASGMGSPETLRYIIHWTEDGKPVSAEVKASELSPAPTLPELHDKYMQALNVIAEQARKIEELEKQQAPTAATFEDYIGDDVPLGTITEEFCQAMDEAWADGVGGALLGIIYRWRNGKLIIPQVARLIDESDWSLPTRLANAHKALMLNWDGANYEGRHAKKTAE